MALHSRVETWSNLTELKSFFPAMYGKCTQSDNNGCYKDATQHGIIQPTMSARLRTYERFSFKFGRIEISAQMPEGDWLWPGQYLNHPFLSLNM